MDPEDIDEMPMIDEEEGEEDDIDDIEVDDPMELISRLFQNDDGENVCDILTNINESIQAQTNVLKIIGKILQQHQQQQQVRASKPSLKK